MRYMWRSSFIWLAVCLAWMGSGASVLAQSAASATKAAARAKAPDASPRNVLIYVPFRKIGPLLKKEGIYLSGKQFRRLMQLLKRAQAQLSKGQLPVSYIWTRSRYQVILKGDQLTVHASLSLRLLRANKLLQVPLRLSGLPLHKATLDGKPALLMAGHKQYKLLVKGTGQHTLSLTLKGQVSRVGGWRKLHLQIPATPQTEVQLQAASGWHVALNDRTWRPTKDSKGTLRNATLGPRHTLRLRWRPKAQRTITQSRMMSAMVRLETHLDEGVIRTRAKVSVHVLQGKLQQLTLQLPSADKLVAVDSGSGLLRRWSVQRQGKRKKLVLLFQTPQKGQFSLRLQLERLVQSTRKPATLAPIHVEQAQWQHGWIALTTARTLELKVKQQQGVTQMDPEEYAVQHRSPAPQQAFLYLTSRYQLQVETHKIKARLRAQVFHRLHVDEKQAVVKTTIRYKIERAGVFQFQFKLPKGWQLREVQCPSMQNYYREKDGTLVVALRQKVGGPVVVQQIAPQRLWQQIQQLLGWDFLRQLSNVQRRQLQRRLSRKAAVLALQKLFGHQRIRNAGPVECHIRLRRDVQFPKGFAMPLVEPLQLESERGLVGVALPSHLELGTHDRKGLMRIDDLDEASAVSKGRYKLRQAFRYAVRPATGKISLKRKKTAIHAKIWLPVQLREDGYQLRGLVRYRVRFAGVKQLQLSVPIALSKRLQITTPTREIHKKAGKEEVLYTLILHRKIPKDGIFSLRFNVTQPLKQALRIGELEQLTLAPFRVPNAVQQSLRWGLQKGEALSLQVAAMKGYRRFDAADLPSWATPRKLTRLLHTRSKAPKKIKVLLRKHRYARVLSTIVTHRHVNAVINRDGKVQALAALLVKNRGRQFLKLQLPPKSKVLALYVAQKERYRFELDRKGELLIDLVNHTSGKPVQITLRYRHDLATGQNLRGWWGKIKVPTPDAIDTPVAMSSLDVYLPQGPSYVAFETKSWHHHNQEGAWALLRTALWGQEHRYYRTPGVPISYRGSVSRLWQQLPKRGRQYRFYSQAQSMKLAVQYRSSGVQLPLEFLFGFFTLIFLLLLNNRQWAWLSTTRLALLSIFVIGLLSALLPPAWIGFTYPAIFAWSGSVAFWMGRGLYLSASAQARLRRAQDDDDSDDSPTHSTPPPPPPKAPKHSAAGSPAKEASAAAQAEEATAEAAVEATDDTGDTDDKGGKHS